MAGDGLVWPDKGLQTCDSLFLPCSDQQLLDFFPATAESKYGGNTTVTEDHFASFTLYTNVGLASAGVGHKTAAKSALRGSFLLSPISNFLTY